jgi:predicted nucleic acid-binding protein
LDFEMVAAEHFEQLRQRYRRLGANDLRIAAIAFATGATLVTRNTVHFSEMAGLLVADWSQR